MQDTPMQRDEVALTAILGEIDAGKIQVYRNVLRQAYVFCDVPGFAALHVHLLDKDFRGWITHFIWTRMSFLLREREMNRILDELAGRSLSEPLDKTADPALLQFIEAEPVVAVVLEFMHTRERHETSMETFWKDLKRFAVDALTEAFVRTSDVV